MVVGPTLLWRLEVMPLRLSESRSREVAHKSRNTISNAPHLRFLTGAGPRRTRVQVETIDGSPAFGVPLNASSYTPATGSSAGSSGGSPAARAPTLMANASEESANRLRALVPALARVYVTGSSPSKQNLCSP